MNFNSNWNEVYPRALYCGDGPTGTSCSETYGYWGRTSTTNPRVIDREGRAANRTINGRWSDGSWKSRNYSAGRGSAPRKIQELLNRNMRDMRNRGVSGVPGNLTVDGILGNASHNAIVWYQGRNGLDTDGIVGNATWQKLRYA
ncbi:MAG: peptidoglycan-binding domain-containing protein [Propionibacteriaceae bacterium]|nr:peptidoglycan-binding domain-containing protein [Propionibacteriaceae bacterium]